MLSLIVLIFMELLALVIIGIRSMRYKIRSKLDDAYSSNFSYPVVSLDNENGHWKITAINLTMASSTR